MAKNGVFKKITALVMAIALVVCFAVSASAVTVTTTTKYVDDDYIDVEVNVAGANEGDNVTYYAKNGSTDVHINQDKADENGAVTFNYRTEVGNLGTTTAKVGVTGASSAEEEGGEVDGYTVTLDHQNQTVIATDEGQTKVTFNYSASDGMQFDEVTTVDATITSQSESAGKINVTFAAINGNIALTLHEKEAVGVNATAEVLEIGAKISTGKVDGVIGDVTDADGNVIENADIQASKGDVKLTVIGKATGATKYGILVSKSAITTYDANIAYEGITMLEEDDDKLGYEQGLFAVQIIDTSKTGAMIEAGATYNVKVYAYDEAADKYVLSEANTTIEIPAAEEN